MACLNDENKNNSRHSSGRRKQHWMQKQHWMRSTVVVWGGGSNVYAVRFQTFKREEGTTLDGNECMSSTQVAVTYQRRIVGTVKKCISVTHACVWLNSSAKSHE